MDEGHLSETEGLRSTSGSDEEQKDMVFIHSLEEGGANDH